MMERQVRDRVVLQAMDRQAGSYEWGERDCLTTAAAIVNDLAGAAVLDYADAHTHMSEARCMAAARKLYGSIPAAHAAKFGAVEQITLINPHDLTRCAGDLLVVCGRLLIPGSAEPWDTEERGELLVFSTPDGSYYHWQQYGLGCMRGEGTIMARYRVTG